ncbi:fibronectin type III domain-containing protein [Tenacibaculum amylolyticum]|uniref:fibronectin type III domain-containing protein n=1 Tax=Tenacibaculum amylolyticum TaxID=104269 RepID=UPI0038964D1F
MKNTSLRNVFLTSFLCVGLLSITAQETRSSKQITTQKTQKTTKVKQANQQAFTKTIDSKSIKNAYSQERCSLNAPSNFAASNINENDFSLSWDPVPGAVFYTLEITATTDGVYAPGKINVGGSPHIIFGLAPGNEYECSVVANCANGQSGSSTIITVTTGGSTASPYCKSEGKSVRDEYIGRVQLGAIDNATQKDKGYSDHTNLSTELSINSSNSITITPTWSGSPYQEGYGIWIDYNNDGDFSDNGETVWTTPPTRDASVSTTFTVPSHATLGATRMRIVLRYSDSNEIPTACETSFEYGEVEDYTVVITPDTTDYEAPSVPGNLTATDISFTSASLTWDPSTDNVGVVGYDIYKGNSLVQSTTNTSFNLTGLAINTSHTYSVKAKDEQGNTSDPATVTFRTLKDNEAPSTPLNLAISNLTCTSAKLSWGSCNDNVGVAGYDVYLNGTLVGTTSNTSFNFTGLSVNASYTCAVRCKDSSGNTSTSASTSFKTPKDVDAPTKPFNLRVSNLTCLSAKLSWGACNDNVGVAGYDVYKNGALIASTSSTSLNLTGLSVNTQYNCSVRCKDAAGNVSAAASVTFRTPKDVDAPTKPFNLRVSNVTKTSAKLTWGACNDNVGVAGYDLYKNGALIATTSNTNYTLTGLTPGTTYTCKVRCKDAAGNVSAAASVTFTTIPNSNFCVATCNSTAAGWVDYVNFGGMTCRSGASSGYANYTNKVARVSRGGSQLLTVSAGTVNSQNVLFFGVWIDYDKDGQFEDDEKVMSNASTDGGYRSTSVSVPAFAKLGLTRMRVIIKLGTEPDPCGVCDYGEVEDYTVNITNTANKAKGLSELSTYPNPVTNSIQVKSLSNSKNKVYRILTTTGQVLASDKLKTSTLNITHLQSGVYILEVNDGQKSYTTKFIKK